MADEQPEVWLRGPVQGFEPLLMPVAHALLQVREDLERLAARVPAPGNATASAAMARRAAVCIGAGSLLRISNVHRVGGVPASPTCRHAGSGYQ